MHKRYALAQFFQQTGQMMDDMTITNLNWILTKNQDWRGILKLLFYELAGFLFLDVGQLDHL